MGGRLKERRFAAVFVELADTLVDDFDVIDFLHQLTRTCVDLLDIAAAGLLLTDQRDTLRVMAASTEETRLLELFQLQADQGPCLECFRTGQPVVAEDLSGPDAARWPRFAAEARNTGYTSVHAVPMRLRAETIGALNLFGIRPGPLPADTLTIAQAFADVATIGLLQERLIRQGESVAEQLQTALNSRVLIEQAKGVIAERNHVDVVTAFTLLRRAARDTNRRLSEFAGDIVPGATHV